MKKVIFFTVIIVLSFFIQCSNGKKACVTREWKVMDLYRNNYSALIDTVCDDSVVLVNKVKVASSFSDSVFNHTGSSKFFYLDTNETYQVDTNISIEINGVKYETAKVRYLHKGYNVDQGFFLYVVKNKGIYIQQESHDKKLFLLNQIRRGSEEPENTIGVTDELIKDTVLFPLPPQMNTVNFEDQSY